MGGIIGGGGGGDSNVSRLAGLDVSTSVYGKVIPVTFGKCRVAVNLLDYADFRSTANKTSSGGKGGGGGTVSSYNYFANIIALVCFGEIGGVGTFWKDKDKYSSQDLGLSVFTGSVGQLPWAVWQSLHPERALPYSGLAYVAGVDFALGTSGGVPNLTVEVFGINHTDTSFGGAWPKNIITGILTSKIYGLGISSSNISSMSSYDAYCKANNFALCAQYTEQRQTAEVLEEICDATNSECVIVSGSSRNMVIDFIPLDVASISGNGVTFTPNNRPIVDIYFEDLLGVVEDGEATGENGVEVEITSCDDLINNQPVEYTDILKEYNASTVYEPIDSDISENGEKVGNSLSLKLIPSAEHASKIAKAKAIRSIYVRKTYKFSVSMRFQFLERGDIVNLTNKFIGLDHAPVRIKALRYPDQSSIEIWAEEWIGIPGATIYARDGHAHDGDASDQPPPAASQTESGASGGAGASHGAAPGASQAPLVFEPPLTLTGGAREVWIATTGGKDWGGAYVHVSIDGAGATYAAVGRVSGRARYGITTQAVGSSTSDTIRVLLSGYQPDPLDSTSSAGLTSAVTSSCLGGEVVAYQQSTLTGPNAYSLATLRRGLNNTAAASHASGSAFARLDGNIFKYPLPSGISSGQQIKIKLQSYNTLGGGLQNISDCTAYNYTIATQSVSTPSSVNISVSTTKPTASGLFVEFDKSGTNVKTGTFEIIEPIGVYPIAPTAHPFDGATNDVFYGYDGNTQGTSALILEVKRGEVIDISVTGSVKPFTSNANTIGPAGVDGNTFGVTNVRLPSAPITPWGIYSNSNPKDFCAPIAYWCSSPNTPIRSQLPQTAYRGAVIGESLRLTVPTTTADGSPSGYDILDTLYLQIGINSHTLNTHTGAGFVATINRVKSAVTTKEAKYQWVTVDWSWSGDDPDSFQIALSSQNGANIEKSLLMDVVVCDGSIRKAIIPVSLSESSTIYASVRAVYAD